MSNPESTTPEAGSKPTAPINTWPGKGGRDGSDNNPPGGWRVKKPGDTAKKKKNKKK